MTKSKLSRLAMAILAAGALSGPISPALAYEMSATLALQNVAAFVQQDDTASAVALIEQIRGLGITAISIGGTTTTLDELIALILAGEGNPAAVAQLVALVNDALASGSVFLSGDLVVASVETDDFDTPLFPTGSVG